MITADSLRSGAVVRVDKEFHKIVESVLHSGGGKAGSMVHVKLRSLSTGHVSERRFAPDDKIDDVEVSRAKMQLLYREGEVFHFMNLQSFDQIPIQGHAVGPAAAFLKENDECEVEFFEEKPLSVIYPEAVELKVDSTGAGSKGHGDSTFKEAVLENGMTVLVPHFIKEGDRVRIEVETGKYLDRVSDREVKGAKFTTKAPPQRAEPKADKPAAAPAAPPAKDKPEPKKG